MHTCARVCVCVCRRKGWSCEGREFILLCIGVWKMPECCLSLHWWCAAATWSRKVNLPSDTHRLYCNSCPFAITHLWHPYKYTHSVHYYFKKGHYVTLLSVSVLWSLCCHMNANETESIQRHSRWTKTNNLKIKAHSCLCQSQRTWADSYFCL